MMMARALGTVVPGMVLKSMDVPIEQNSSGCMMCIQKTANWSSTCNLNDGDGPAGGQKSILLGKLTAAGAKR